MKFKNIIINLLIFVCLITFLVSTYILIKDFKYNNDNTHYTEQLIETAIIETSTELINSTGPKSIDWNYLKSVNEDIIAWIEIENTNINYPILKDSNLFYLKHSYNKKYNNNGSIFTTDTSPFEIEETIIYGHNMKNKSMFSELGNYLNKDFFYSHNKINLYTPNGNYEGFIFSAYSISIDIENNNIKSLNFNERLDYYKNASTYKVDIDYNINKIIKLSTCSYINAKVSPTDQRYYIIASLSPAM